MISHFYCVIFTILITLRVSVVAKGTPETRRQPAADPGSGTNEANFLQLVMADAVEIETMKNYNIAFERIDPSINRYPYCIVWTPIPVLS